MTKNKRSGDFLDKSPSIGGLNDSQLNVVLEGQLRGLTAKEISSFLEVKTGKKLQPSTIGHILAKQREHWRESNRQDTEYYIQQELDRLRMMEREAWRQYEACGGTLQKEVVNRLFDEDDTLIQHSVTIETKDDPSKAIQWFDRLLRIQTDRRKILKLEKVIHLEANVFAVKGYSGWSPDEVWPDPPKELNGGDVIEGETVD